MIHHCFLRPVSGYYYRTSCILDHSRSHLKPFGFI